MHSEARDGRLFWTCAGGAALLHAILLLVPPGLRGGADLVPHLRLIQLMGEEPAIRSVYSPTYHVLGALLAPLLGLTLYPKLFAVLGAAAWMGGARFLQRAMGLPEASAALLVLSPYSFAFSWCLPKVEAVGYGLVFVGLGLLAQRRYVGVALTLAVTFWVHTASALFFGIATGVFALARLDVRGLLALAVGTLGAAPLHAIHLADGCALFQALRMTGYDYLRPGAGGGGLAVWPLAGVLASPLAVVLAALGARPLWRRDRALAVLCAVLVILYLNELWLGAFGMRISLTLMRALSMLALPVAVAAGVAVAARPRLAPWLMGACALWSAGAALVAVPRSCHVREIRLAELRELQVDRCNFRWWGPAFGPAPPRVAP